MRRGWDVHVLSGGKSGTLRQDGFTVYKDSRGRLTRRLGTEWAFWPAPPPPEGSDRRCAAASRLPVSVWAAAMTRVKPGGPDHRGARHPGHQRLQSSLRGAGRRHRGRDVPYSRGGHQPRRDLQPSRGHRSAGENGPAHHGGGNRAHLFDPPLRGQLPGSGTVTGREGAALRDRRGGGSTGYRAGMLLRRRLGIPADARDRAVRRSTGARHGSAGSAGWAPTAAGKSPGAAGSSWPAPPASCGAPLRAPRPLAG